MIVGTAGHIDHGKTALVKALTGVDADRLKDLSFGDMPDSNLRHNRDAHSCFDLLNHCRITR